MRMNSYLDYETLLELENRNLSYEEMIKELDLHISKSFLSRKFKELGIKHKTKAERLEKKILETEGSIRFLANKFKVSPNTVQKIKRCNKENMTTCNIEFSKTTTTVEIYGHCGFAPYGNDIVCASLSTLVFALLNMSSAFLQNVTNYSLENGYCYIELRTKGKKQQSVFNIFKDMIIDLSSQYPENLVVNLK